jgi:hypothetical protein
MTDSASISIEQGLRADHRDAAAALFWEAFKGKLMPVMKPEAKALAFLRSAIDPSHAISAVSERGELLGIVGFKTTEGGFVGGGLSGDVKGLRAGWWILARFVAFGAGAAG